MITIFFVHRKNDLGVKEVQGVAVISKSIQVYMMMMGEIRPKDGQTDTDRQTVDSNNAVSWLTWTTSPE